MNTNRMVPSLVFNPRRNIEGELPLSGKDIRSELLRKRVCMCRTFADDPDRR